MIEWTVRTALGARRVDRVVVSTEDEEIASKARDAGAEIIMRPAELAIAGAAGPPLENKIRRLADDPPATENQRNRECKNPRLHANFLLRSSIRVHTRAATSPQASRSVALAWQPRTIEPHATILLG